MNKEEFVKYVQDSFKKIFGAEYNDERATAAAYNFLVMAKDNIDNAKQAADAVISRTEAKLKASGKYFDKFPAWAIKIDGKEVSVDETGKVVVDGKDQPWKVDMRDSFTKVIEEIRNKLKSKGDIKGVMKTFSDIKEQLFDAPVDVKMAFNTLVTYFADEDKDKFIYGIVDKDCNLLSDVSGDRGKLDEELKSKFTEVQGARVARLDKDKKVIE